jgi:hypothetical protein
MSSEIEAEQDWQNKTGRKDWQNKTGKTSSGNDQARAGLTEHK